jgi:hypothetical protein
MPTNVFRQLFPFRLQFLKPTFAKVAVTELIELHDRVGRVGFGYCDDVDFVWVAGYRCARILHRLSQFSVALFHASIFPIIVAN